jgi:hypothetical protein
VDRRGFIGKALGAAAALATTKLWLPPISTALAEPERTVFLPPAGGWPGYSEDEDAANFRLGGFNARQIPGTNIVYVDTASVAAEAFNLGDYYRGETTYDVVTFDTLPNEVFALNPHDTVRVMFGPARQAGVMIVDQIDLDTFTNRVRIRGRGAESFLGHHLNPPIATIEADSGRVTRSLRDGFPGYFG